MTSVCYLVAFHASVEMTVFIGGGGGAGLGVLGGVFGTYCSVLRGRVSQMIAQDNREGTTP